MSKINVRDLMTTVYKESLGLRVHIESNLLDKVLSENPIEVVTHVFAFGEAFYERFLLTYPHVWLKFSVFHWLEIIKNQNSKEEYQVAVLSFLNKYVQLNFLEFTLKNVSESDSEKIIKYLKQIPGVLLRNDDVILTCFEELPTTFESVYGALIEFEGINNSFKNKQEVMDYLSTLPR